jgi:hypothetical protein
MAKDEEPELPTQLMIAPNAELDRLIADLRHIHSPKENPPPLTRKRLGRWLAGGARINWCRSCRSSW